MLDYFWGETAERGGVEGWQTWLGRWGERLEAAAAAEEGAQAGGCEEGIEVDPEMVPGHDYEDEEDGKSGLGVAHFCTVKVFHESDKERVLLPVGERETDGKDGTRWIFNR
jgi:hypothetical protein